jgi:site-specific DNA recombinase
MEVVAEVYDRGPVDYRVVATKGKGERLDRPGLAKMEAMLRTRELDLLVFEDLGRSASPLTPAPAGVFLCTLAVAGRPSPAV